jgi:hypothetical protein
VAEAISLAVDHGIIVVEVAGRVDAKTLVRRKSAKADGLCLFIEKSPEQHYCSAQYLDGSFGLIGMLVHLQHGTGEVCGIVLTNQPGIAALVSHASYATKSLFSAFHSRFHILVDNYLNTFH